MQETNSYAVRSNGGNALETLPIYLDELGERCVAYQGEWAYADKESLPGFLRIESYPKFRSELQRSFR